MISERRENRLQAFYKNLEDVSGAQIIMHSFIMDCDSFSNEVKVALVATVPSVEAEVTVSKAVFALRFSSLLLRCLMKNTGKICRRSNVSQCFG